MIERAQCRGRVGEKRVTFERERDAARGAQEERDAEQLFEAANAAAMLNDLVQIISFVSAVACRHLSRMASRITSRRAFIIQGVQASLLAPALLAQACGTRDRSIADAGRAARDAQAPDRPGRDASDDGAPGDYDGSYGPVPDASSPYDRDGSAAGDASDPQACVVTRPDIEGPYFKPSSPERTSLVEAGLPGVQLALSGKIVDTACMPIAGAIIDFWQANDDGAYDSAGFTLRGHQIVGEDGHYELKTIVPGRYLNGSQYRPAHLHCKVYVEGREVLTTQLYFEGDPYNDIDPWFSELTMLRPREVAGASGDLTADFDFSVV